MSSFKFSIWNELLNLEKKTRTVAPLGAVIRKDRMGPDACRFHDPNGRKPDQNPIRLDGHVGDDALTPSTTHPRPGSPIGSGILSVM